VFRGGAELVVRDRLGSVVFVGAGGEHAGGLRGVVFVGGVSPGRHAVAEPGRGRVELGGG
jgi:hypothetical protein